MLTADDLRLAEPQAWQAVAGMLPFQRYGQAESCAFWKAFYATLLKSVGVAPAERLCGQIYSEFQQVENWRDYPDAIPVLRELKARGYRLGVVSNWEEWLDQLLAALGMSDVFEVIVASGSFGRAKPDPSIFWEALRALDVRPDAAVHVGDSLRDDVCGAQAAGIRAILVDRRDRFPDAGVERVLSLSELLSILA